MQQLATAQSLSELKYQYRKLAAIHHPDRGGSVVYMQEINAQYDLLHERFIGNDCCANDEQNCYDSCSTHSSKQNPYYDQKEDFSQLNPGDFLFVNNTLSEVLEISVTAFRVVAKGRNRQAWFGIDDGIGLYNKKLHASFNPIPRPSSQKH